MKKSQLKEVIHNIVTRKLAESSGQKVTNYGYVMSGKDTDDPTYQLIGYGNMPKSLWEKKLERYAEELLKRVKNKDWKNAAYFMEKNGVFNSAVNMMKELSDQSINELDSADEMKEKAAQKALEDAKKKESDALEKKREVDKKKADFNRRNYPVVNKNERESIKADIEVGKASVKAAEVQADLAKKQAKNQ